MEQRLLVRWEELLATEAIVDQIAAEFGGEDPLKPASRAGLQHAREIGEKLAHELGASAAARILQVDISPKELGRNYRNTVSLHGDAKLTLRRMLEMVEPLAREGWLTETGSVVSDWRAENRRAVELVNGHRWTTSCMDRQASFLIQSSIRTVRATSPAFIARNASLMSSSRRRLVIISSSFNLP
jgi:thiamine pyrophosphate-dependent acetolactate synthase large subunit-like protein